MVAAMGSRDNLTGWLWTGLIERISQDQRSRACGEVRRRARSRLCSAAPDRGADSPGQELGAGSAKEAEFSEQSYDRWRKEYGGLQVDQARKMKDLERENARLRRLVADLPLEKQMLADVAAGNLEPPSDAGRRLRASRTPRQS